MTESDCLLCKISRGEIRVSKIIETDAVMGVINTIEAYSRGHAVFFAKRHAASFHEVEDWELAEIVRCIKKVVAALELENYNILQNNGALAGQTVFHAHFHLIPKWTDGDGLRYDRSFQSDIDHREISRRLRERL
jgi:histidine triad (HIT) family protein